MYFSGVPAKIPKFLWGKSAIIDHHLVETALHEAKKLSLANGQWCAGVGYYICTKRSRFHLALC